MLFSFTVARLAALFALLLLWLLLWLLLRRSLGRRLRTGHRLRRGLWRWLRLAEGRRFARFALLPLFALMLALLFALLAEGIALRLRLSLRLWPGCRRRLCRLRELMLGRRLWLALLLLGLLLHQYGLAVRTALGIAALAIAAVALALALIIPVLPRAALQVGGGRLQRALGLLRTRRGYRRGSRRLREQRGWRLGLLAAGAKARLALVVAVAPGFDHAAWRHRARPCARHRQRRGRQRHVARIVGRQRNARRLADVDRAARIELLARQHRHAFAAHFALRFPVHAAMVLPA